MKTTYVIAFFIAWICMVFCGVFTILASIINLLIVDERVCIVAYSVFFTCFFVRLMDIKSFEIKYMQHEA